MADIVRRVRDVLVSASALIILSPVMLLTALVVRLALGRPVLYRQTRPGLHGRPFTLYKFRTMRQLAPGEDMLATDDARMTRIGSLLRSTSLDELPQFFNVLVGDMSLVGPRPLLMEYLDAYTERQAHRHDVRPGITGWSQVRGRNALDWEDRLEMDVYYVENRSLLLDLKILLETPMVAFSGRGVSAPGSTTMPALTRREHADKADGD